MSRKKKKKFHSQNNKALQPAMSPRQKRLDFLKKSGDWQGIIDLLQTPHDAREAWELVVACEKLQEWELAVETFRKYRDEFSGRYLFWPFLLKNAGLEEEALQVTEEILARPDVKPCWLAVLASEFSKTHDGLSLKRKPLMAGMAIRLYERALSDDSIDLPENDRAGEWAYQQYGNLLWSIEIDLEERRSKLRQSYRKAYGLYHSREILGALANILEPKEAIELLEQELVPTENLTLEPIWLASLLEKYRQAGDHNGLLMLLEHSNLEMDKADAVWFRAFALAQLADQADDARLSEARLLAKTLPTDFNVNMRASLHLHLAAASWDAGDRDHWIEHMTDALNVIRSAFQQYSVNGYETITIRSRTKPEDTATVLIVSEPRWQEALEAFSEETDITVEVRGYAHLLLSMTFDDAGDYEVAQGLLQKAVEMLGNTLWGDDLIEKFALAVHEQFEAYKRSVQHFRQEDPNYTRSFSFWFDPEQTSADEALAIHASLNSWPTDFPQNLIREIQLDAWYNCQWLELLKTHQHHRAIVEACETVLKYEQEDDMYFNLGYHALEINEPVFVEKAVHAFLDYLRVNPGNAAALHNLGIAYQRQGKLEDALRAFEQAVEVDPADQGRKDTVEKLRARLMAAMPNPLGIDLRFVEDITTKAQEVATAYWQQDAAGAWVHALKNLGVQFGLTSAQLKDMAVKHSWALSRTIRCAACGTSYEYTSRQDFLDKQNGHRTYTCSKCQQLQKDEAKANSAKILERQREIVQQRFDLSATPALDVNLLTLEDAVYLLSAIRAGAAENLRYIVPFNEFKQPLGPTPDFGKSMLTHLFERKILRIHPASSPGAFEWQDDDPARLKIPEIHWGIAMGGPQLPFGSVIEQLEEKFRAGSSSWTQAWRDEITTLWRNILLQEAIRHLLLCLEDHGFHFSPGEKTNTVLRALLEEFTLAQVWNMTWNCAKNAAAYYMRERIPKQQAANSVISRLQSYAERANSEGWEIKAARRDRRTPEPVVSQVFFTAALRIGIGYQERMPFQETLVPLDITIH